MNLYGTIFSIIFSTSIILSTGISIYLSTLFKKILFCNFLLNNFFNRNFFFNFNYFFIILWFFCNSLKSHLMFIFNKSIMFNILFNWHLNEFFLWNKITSLIHLFNSMITIGNYNIPLLLVHIMWGLIHILRRLIYLFLIIPLILFIKKYFFTIPFRTF